MEVEEEDQEEEAAEEEEKEDDYDNDGLGWWEHPVVDFTVCSLWLQDGACSVAWSKQYM